MSDTFSKIKQLISEGKVRISNHGYDELSEDDIFVRDIMKNVDKGTVVEDYPTYPKGPCVLVLQYDGSNNAIHVVWGIPKESESIAVLVTAYRPDPAIWKENYKERRK